MPKCNCNQHNNQVSWPQYQAQKIAQHKVFSEMSNWCAMCCNQCCCEGCSNITTQTGLSALQGVQHFVETKSLTLRFFKTNHDAFKNSVKRDPHLKLLMVLKQKELASFPSIFLHLKIWKATTSSDKKIPNFSMTLLIFAWLFTDEEGNMSFLGFSLTAGHPASTLGAFCPVSPYQEMAYKCKFEFSCV